MLSKLLFRNLEVLLTAMNVISIAEKLIKVFKGFINAIVVDIIPKKWCNYKDEEKGWCLWRKNGEGCEKERKRMKRKKRIEENAEQIRERIAKKVMQEAREC